MVKLTAILFFVLLMGIGNSQNFNLTGSSVPPFSSSNDDFYSGANLNSAVLNLGLSTGAAAIQLEFDSTNVVAGNAAWGNLDIYFKVRLSGLNWAVPYDSIGVDSIYFARIDSTNMMDGGDPFIINLATQDWYGYVDECQIILDPVGVMDSVRVNCRAKGLKHAK